MKHDKASQLSTKKLNRNLSLSPLFIKFDKVGRAHFRPTVSTAAGAARFRKFQIKLLNGTLGFNDKSIQFAANIIAFDGVVTKPDLIAGLAQQSQLYTWNEHTCLVSNSAQYFPLVSVQLFPLFQPSEIDFCAV